MLGGINPTMNGGEYNQILNGQGNTIDSTFKAQILNGESNQISADNRFSTIMNGYANNISADGQGGTIVESWSSTIGGSNSYRNSIYNSESGTITSSGGTSSFNSIRNTYQSNIQVGGQQNLIDSSYQSALQGNVNYGNIIACYDVDIIGSGERLNIFNSLQSNILTTNSNQISIYSSDDCFITGSNMNHSATINSDDVNIYGGNYNTAVGSYLSTISGGSNNFGLFNTIQSNSGGYDYSNMIGTSGRTAARSYTTYVENSHAFGNITQPVINAGNVGGGTISVDLSQGDQFIFSLTGTSGVSFINKQEGQRCLFFVYSNGAHNISAMTINSGSVYTTGGNLPTPTNNGYTMYEGWVMNGDMILLEHDGLDAI